MQDSHSRASDDSRNSPFETPDALPQTTGNKRPLSRVLIVCVVVGALLIGYLLLAKTVTVSSNTENFSVADNSLLGIAYGNRLLLLPGQHTLRITAPDYTPQDVELKLSSDKNTQIHVELLPLPGQLQVNTDTDAEVYLNGEQVGNSNTALPDIAAGDYLLRVTAEHYKPFEQNIVIEGRRKTLTLDAELQPDWITQEVISTPAGAEVFVNQQTAGVTPTTVKLTRGEQQLRLQLNGYRVWEQSLNIDPDTPFQLPSIELQPELITLKISSSPSKAQVTIDGIYQGETPLTAKLPAAQRATVVLIKDGYKVQQRQVSLTSPPETSANAPALHVDMAATLGRINLNISPANAKVSLEGKLQRANNNRYSLQLPTHPHKVVVSAPGYETQGLTLTPRAGLAQHLNVSLLTLEQARWKNTPALSQSATGQELKLFKPQATFTMGASRREQGRRSNETQHRVTLDRAFYLATKPVTNADFREFQRFHSAGNVKGQSLDGDQQPVVNISWVQAAQFCNWLSEQAKLSPVYTFNDGALQSVDMNSNGYRLPTEAEWAWAARFDNAAMQTYPWGNSRVNPTPKSANYADTKSRRLTGTTLSNYEDNHLVSAPVASYSANAKGIYDLAGNVSEWIHDYYGIKAGLSLKAVPNPSGPLSGDAHVIRGSSWKSGSLSELRLAYRDSGNEKQNHVGFRIARYVFAEK